jgi:AcrR family transcriptional regulator
MARRPTPHARAKLIEAARAEMALRGLHGARIEDIAAKSGLSKGAFYLHFPSKESLFATLVKKFERGMDDCIRARRTLTDAFLAQGAITAKDIERQSPRYLEQRALEEEEDIRTLELMWEFRDIVEVLISGAQGTPFEGLLWKLVEREASRVADEYRLKQEEGLCRTDVPPEIFGAMMVGTYLLLAHRLCQMEEKPDLRTWARSLQALVHQGAGFTLTAPHSKSAPRPNRPQLEPAAPVARAPAAAAARVRKTRRSTTRSSP